MARSKDLLDEIVAARARRNPAFPKLVDDALERRKLLRRLASERERAGISQTLVAAVMGTSQSAVARIEAGETDVRLSTLEHYAAAIGRRITWTLAPRKGSARRRRPPA